MSDLQKQIVLVTVFAPIAAAAYGGLINQPWSYDDEPHVAKAEAVLVSPSVLLDWTSKEPLRFVSHLYFLCVFVVAGASTVAYHLGNILLHLLATLLFVRLTRELIDGDTAIITGLLFLISATGYEAVYPVAASAALLGAAFAFFSLERAITYL